MNKVQTGEDLADAYLRCESKAVRRSVLNLIGMGAMEDAEAEAVPVSTQAKPPKMSIRMDFSTLAVPVSTQAKPREKENSKHDVDPKAVHGEAADKSLQEVEVITFPMGWNKGLSLGEVYNTKGEKEISNAIKWAEENNSFFEWVQHAKRFLQLMQQSDPKPEAVQEEGKDLPF